MNSNNIDREMSSEEREPLTSDYDFLEAATKYLYSTDGFFRNVPTSIYGTDQEQSSLSTTSYPPASAFQSPARSQHSQHYLTKQRRNDDTTSASAASWNSVNANSQMSTWTPSFISHYMIPWQQEEKPSSWDEESDEGDTAEFFRDEPHGRRMSQNSDVGSVVSRRSTKKSSRKSRGLCDILCMEIEIPIPTAYGIVVLVFTLIALCFVIGYLSEKQASQGRFVSAAVLAPVTVTTPTLAPTALTAIPTQAPTLRATPKPTEACENKLKVDKLCYIAGDDGILVEFDVCTSKDSDWIGIYPVSETMLTDDYAEWSWSCGTKLCRSSPQTNDFAISTERLKQEGLYRAYYMRYNNDGSPFASVAMSEIFQISSRCM